MGQCTELMKEAYQSNPRFRQYVDRYREHHNDDLTAITADEALQHACVEEVYLYYLEQRVESIQKSEKCLRDSFQYGLKEAMAMMNEIGQIIRSTGQCKQLAKEEGTEGK